MECDVCRSRSTKFFCQICLKDRVRSHRQGLARIAEAHQATVRRAIEILEAPGAVDERRAAKARRASIREKVLEVQEEAKRCRADSERLRSGVAEKRKDLEGRRARLSRAREELAASVRVGQGVAGSGLKRAGVEREWRLVLDTLRQTRLMLLRTLRKTFALERIPNLTPVNLQAPRGSLAAHPGSVGFMYAIGGLRLPPASAIAASPSAVSLKAASPSASATQPYSGSPARFALAVSDQELDAATIHVANVARLAALYLGIKLPFNLTLSGRPHIKAVSGSVWAGKFPKAYPLYLPSASASSSSGGPSAGTRASARTGYLIGLTLLSWTCAYLLSTQRAPAAASLVSSPGAVPPPPLDDALANLGTLLYELSSVGVRSHLTGSPSDRLPRPETLVALPAWGGANLGDLAVVVEGVIGGASEGRKGKKGKEKEEVVEGGWSLL